MSSSNNTHSSSSSLLLDIEDNLNKKKENSNPISKPSFLKLSQQQDGTNEGMPRFAPSELLSRLQSFLPQIKEANEKLESGEVEGFSDCVEIIENDDEEEQDGAQLQEENYNDEEESEHKPYVEMNVVLGVLEQKQKTSLITDIDGPTEDEQKLEEKDEVVNLRIGKDFTPQESKNIEQDMVAYMNIMNSLLGSSSALKRKRVEDNSDSGSSGDSSDSDQD
ncbi:predicted protein [Naegleria gruberi]|uniref:Predicted protein n=1 Tax=Naegleria gruberi TaxID=5762 RepID=D2V789_NAEGR|nr:uncharacterized protein NAEGRDRAFT_47227 [Naegleria gruberi]EFC47215.1 predicted protein [Naegleria gruberi]|eukprot:XP_002679959.1 predicted protein [Naegleria gruberi strain NEG-M]